MRIGLRCGCWNTPLVTRQDWELVRWVNLPDDEGRSGGMGDLWVKGSQRGVGELAFGEAEEGALGWR